jgi:hypothetical protein
MSACLCTLLVAALGLGAQEKPVVVDPAKKTVTIACTVAPRKLPDLAEVYPLEVVATYPAPKMRTPDNTRGQKAHETVVIFDEGIKPSAIHKALEELGLKPGKPAMGEGQVATGPEVKVYLEVPGSDGQVQRVPIEKTMQDKKTGKPMPMLKWHFTGSIMKQPNPDKPEKFYGADLTGTLITIFPVTNECVIQAGLKFKDQELLRLETNKTLLPKEGAPVKLVIEVK